LRETSIRDHRLSETERELINGCARNDRRSQRELYDRYCNAMFSTAYRILNNSDDANDTLQEAFLQVFRNIRQFRAESTLGAWIRTIVVRSSLRHLKNNPVPEHSEPEEAAADIAVTVPDTMTGELLEKVILSLPDGYRTVFLLVEVEGYTHAETANMLGITEGTSKSQLSRAKKQLQQKLIHFLD
jgi:RNA polymerase sigma factor (sigma-70 family)